jgi:hypothetical protein
MRRNYYEFLVVKLKLSLQKFYCRNRDHTLYAYRWCIIVIVIASSLVDRVLEPGRVKPNTMHLVFVSSQLSTRLFQKRIVRARFNVYVFLQLKANFIFSY